MEQTILMKPVKHIFQKQNNKPIKETRIMYILSSFSYSEWQWVPGILHLHCELFTSSNAISYIWLASSQALYAFNMCSMHQDAYKLLNLYGTNWQKEQQWMCLQSIIISHVLKLHVYSIQNPWTTEHTSLYVLRESFSGMTYLKMPEKHFG